MNRNQQITDRRDRDFMSACRRAMPKIKGPLTSMAIAEMAAKSPAPEFYVSYLHALRTVSLMRRREGFPKSGNRSQYAEISRRAGILEHRHGLKLRDAVARVLAEGNAPSFYLTPLSARNLFNKLSRRARQRHQPSYRRRPKTD